MIQYTANDIVEKALALADLQNSDFISYKEKIQYLNDAYCYMYNKVIDYGDNLYTQIVEITDGESELPDDFYQLREVFVLNDKVKTLITPKPLNQSLNDLSYEIVNNTMYIYGKTQGKVYYSYYLVPQTLITKRENKELDIDISDLNKNLYELKLIIFNKNLYARWNSAESTVVKDLLNSNREKVLEGAIPHHLTSIGVNTSALLGTMLSNKGLAVITHNNGVETIIYNAIQRYPTKEYGIVQRNGDDFIPVFFNNDLYITDGNKIKNVRTSDNAIVNTGAIVYEMSDTLHGLIETYSSDSNNNLYLFCFGEKFDEDNMLFVCVSSVNDGNNVSQTIKYSTNLETVEEKTFDVNSLMAGLYFSTNNSIVGNSVLFVSKDNKLYQLSSNTDGIEFIHEVDDSLTLISVDDISADTGYGLICYDFMSDKLVMASAFDDTLLSFPNNTYFTLMAYHLAILFGQKQNKDTTQLRMELEKQENIFYDSLHRDETSFRITNVNSSYTF